MVPVGHGWHAALDAPPRKGLNVPMGHGRQKSGDAAPSCSPYVPAEHFEHATVLLFCPGSTPYWPDGHSVQPTALLCGEYEPTAHGVHSVPLMNVPAGHVIARSHCVAPTEAVVPPRHDVQSVLL